MHATMMDSFKEYIKLFNSALASGNTADALRIGKKLVQIADGECARPNVDESFKNYYRSQASKVREFIADTSSGSVRSKNTDTVHRKEEKPKNKWFSDKVPKLTLKDVAGLDDIKRKFLVNIVAPFTDCAHIYRKYRGTQYNAQILLYGPPGTGKTFLVKCLAGTLGFHIAVVQTKDILANLVGDAEKNIAEVFEEAKQYDNCIIFFDEIDSIAASRDNDESRNTKGVLTTLLTMMDGFTGVAKEGQHRIIIAATNRPWVLDSAVKRGGRFETQIYVPLPDFDARCRLVQLALGKDASVKDRIDIPCAPDVTVAWLASKLGGMAGADINAVCRQIVNAPLLREINNYRAEKPCDEYVTRDDCTSVISGYINSITDEMLWEFDAYSANLSFNEWYKVIVPRLKRDRAEGKEIQPYLMNLLTMALEEEDKLAKLRYLESRGRTDKDDE